jgi:hypothetical protein
MFSTAFIKELDALCAQHGVARSFSGNKISLIDTGGVEQQGRASLRQQGAYFGLSEDDYGTVFAAQGTAYRLVGLKAHRPSYPLECERVHDGKAFKFPRSVVPQIVAKRAAKQPVAPTQSPPTRPNTVLNPPRPQDLAGLSELAGFGQF